MHTNKRLILIASFNWFLLSFLAGNVNAGGYLACSRFVTHVTGFATLFGMEAGTGNIRGAFGIMSVPLFFLVGAMISAYFVDRRFHQGEKPRYVIVMGLVATCLLLAVFLGSRGVFGPFGNATRLREDYILLALLCTASGLQNAAVTTSTGFAVRTTHLTGITTDLAIGLVRAQSVSRDTQTYVTEMRNNWLRIGTIASFMFGSVVGVLVFMRHGYNGFFLPAGIALYEMFIAWQHKEMFTTRHTWLRAGRIEQ